MANLKNPALHSAPGCTLLKSPNLLVMTFLFASPSDVCIGLRLQQVMKSQWQTKSLERSKPLKKLSLKHKLSSSKEKHKFTNSLMAVSKYKCCWDTETHVYPVILKELSEMILL